jgi:hypothetical protein
MSAMYFDGSWNVNYYTELFGDDLALRICRSTTERRATSCTLCLGRLRADQGARGVKTYLTYLASEEAQDYTYTSVIPAFTGLSDKWAARIRS